MVSPEYLRLTSLTSGGKKGFQPQLSNSENRDKSFYRSNGRIRPSKEKFHVHFDVDFYDRHDNPTRCQIL